MDTQKEKLKEYASLKAQIALLEDKIDLLKPEVEVIVTDINPVDGIVETDFGVFTMVSKRKYAYTDKVISAEEKLKELKKQEEATGEAHYEVSRYLKFSSTSIN